MLHIFADDIMIMAKDKEETQEAIKEITSWSNKWNLQINQNKSAILSKRQEFENLQTFNGIPVVNSIKYLGMTLTTTKKVMIDGAIKSVDRIVGMMKGKLEQIMKNFMKSWSMPLADP